MSAALYSAGYWVAGVFVLGVLLLMSLGVAARFVRSCQDREWLYPDSEEERYLTQCAYCRRYKLQNGWRSLLQAPSNYTISHGACPECAAEQLAALDRIRPAVPALTTNRNQERKETVHDFKH